MAFAFEDQTAEESGRWRGNGWGHHNGGGWSRVSSSPWGAHSRRVRQVAQVQSLNNDPNWANANWNDPGWSNHWSNNWGNNWGNTWAENWQNWN